MKEIIVMSTKEANRISILEKVQHKEMKQKKAASILGLSVRQVRRLVRRFVQKGAAGMPHRLRGIPGNRRADQIVLDVAISAVRMRYADFSVTMMHEKVVTNHGFSYSRETLRKGLVSVGLWYPKRQPHPVLHQLRERRAAEGELVQVDGSPHDWFENRGPACTLLVYIDDATGKLLYLECVESETTNAYFGATGRYLESHGKPVAFYVDRHGVFRVNTTKALSARVEDSNGLTQFGRAMKELDISMIFANSPQAKGRVEKANQTLQDRLVKELRLLGISTMAEANKYLPVFMEAFNQRFSVTPRSSVNLHRPLLPSEYVGEILVQKHTRILSKQLTLSYGNQIYQIVTDHPTYALRHVSIEIREDAEGIVTLWLQRKPLAYTIIARQPKSEIVDSKHIGIAVDRFVERIPVKPSLVHPWKQPYLYW